ncbi:MAG TPA: hypothetical protein VHE30_13820 [Polyangiaceae bacterium]|nr:hypothetical protein [Polyangiaceae bacterium]
MKHGILVSLLSLTVAIACGKSSGGGGSNTSWETCTTNLDCQTGEHCVDRRCVADVADSSTSSGGGGSSGAGSGGGGNSSGGATTGGRDGGTAGDASGVDAATPDGAPADASTPVDAGGMLEIRQLVVGERHTCALLDNGAVRCWGGSYTGQLGYGNTNNIGDDEDPVVAGNVSVTTDTNVVVTQLAAGKDHTCAVLSNGTVKCWGKGDQGQLGYGNENTIGDDELPSSVGPVSVTTKPGVTVRKLTAGWSHTCALLSDGTVTCWGSFGTQGGVGYGNTSAVGDDELPSSVGPVSLSTSPEVEAIDIAGGAFHSCALLSDHTTKCWGRGGTGQLGYGNIDNIGDDELPSSIGPVDVSAASGVSAVDLVGGDAHTCARLSDGTAKCWGNGGLFFPGIGLGYGNPDTIGDDELPSSVGPLSLSTSPGLHVLELEAGFEHTCALLSDHTVACWGSNQHGQLGYGRTDTIGDDELPSSVGPVSVTPGPSPGTGPVSALATGTTNYHTCAVVGSSEVKCWGYGEDGQLGTGNKADVGDDELPSSIPPIRLQY